MNLNGKNVLLTGATGGIGVHIARALASEGANISMVAYPGNSLEELTRELSRPEIKLIWFDEDLRNEAGILKVIRDTKEQLGEIDVLINNAGIEVTAPYHSLTFESIDSILRCNLRAPLFLTNLVLEDMLKKNQGHIVNISSLAGKSGPSCQEVYAATKAGLIGFTNSLRATYRKTNIGASVICPGFVEAGIYDRLKTKTGLNAPKLLGTSKPETVGKAVINAILKDLPEVIINPIPVRPLFAISELSPRLGAWLTSLTGAHDFFDQSAERLNMPPEEK
jgi:short-subunit dehydrogenase